MHTAVVPVFLLVASAVVLCTILIAIGYVVNPKRPHRVKRMPYESGMDPIHSARRRFDTRYYLLAIAFLVFDVELLFLYPWAVAQHRVANEGARADTIDVGIGSIDAAVASGVVPSRLFVFAAVMAFVVLLTLGFVYDWRKGVFRWR